MMSDWIIFAVGFAVTILVGTGVTTLIVQNNRIVEREECRAKALAD